VGQIHHQTWPNPLSLLDPLQRSLCACCVSQVPLCSCPHVRVFSPKYPARHACACRHEACRCTPRLVACQLPQPATYVHALVPSHPLCTGAATVPAAVLACMLCRCSLCCHVVGMRRSMTSRAQHVAAGHLPCMLRLGGEPC
jgi:hypothetical protein